MYFGYVDPEEEKLLESVRRGISLKEYEKQLAAQRAAYKTEIRRLNPWWTRVPSWLYIVVGFLAVLAVTR